ncbi:MAG: hypothetical protein IPJ51_06760 [Saprospiraceae bacterium]|nr:hypothetical protein [Saprospiraceae bacterium]
MATLASTILIEGKKFEQDSYLLKSLKLEKKLRASDQHRIGRPNVRYHDALTIENEVFVSEIEGHTIICSDYIPSDFIGNYSTLKSGVFTNFPEGKKVVFFSNSTSLLNGFIIFEGQKLIRMKIVQNGIIEKLSNDDLDFGELLELEIKYYGNNEHLKKSKDYLWGIHDLEIAQQYIEANFNIKDLEKSLESVICNRYSPDEITETELSKSSQEKLSIKSIHDSTNKLIESNFTKLVKEKAKDDFPQVSRVTKYYVELNNNILLVQNKTDFRPASGTNSDITVYLQTKDQSESYSKLPFYIEGIGLPVINYNAHEILINQIGFNERLVVKNDLECYINSIIFPPEFLNSILVDSIDNVYVNNNLYFSTVFDNLQLHSEKKGWIQGYTAIQILMSRIFFEMKNSKQSETFIKLKNFFEKFEATNEDFKKSSDEKVAKFLLIINDLDSNLKVENTEIKAKAVSESDIDIKDTISANVNKRKWWKIWK